MTQCLIIGCGQLGQLLAAKLSQNNITCYGLKRDTRDLPEFIIPIEADVSKPLDKLLPAVDYIIYTVTPNEFSELAYKQAYITGLKNSLAAITRPEQIKRFFYISSTSVYAQKDGEWVDENSPTEPTHFAGSILLTGEAMIKTSGLNYTIIRFAGIYGGKRMRLIKHLKAGQARLSEENVFTNRIHESDCVGFLNYLINHSNPENLYNACDDEPASQNDILLFLAEQLDLPTPAITDQPQHPMRGNKRIRNAKLHESGYELIYPNYQSGYGHLFL